MRLVQPSVSEFEALFDGETRRVWICSPWISKEGVAILAKALARAPGLEELDLWLRVEASESAISDFLAIETFLERLSQSAVRVSIHSAPKLHAKTIWTTKGALIGSMNLTLNGMAGRNVELAVRLEPEEIAAQQSIRELLGSVLSASPSTPGIDSWPGYRQTSRLCQALNLLLKLPRRFRHVPCKLKAMCNRGLRPASAANPCTVANGVIVGRDMTHPAKIRAAQSSEPLPAARSRSDPASYPRRSLGGEWVRYVGGSV